jgi:prepilin-type processing-associated H-X9-DG protein
MLSLSIANVIVPYFTGHTKAGFLLLIPIIIIEAVLLRQILKRTWLESFKLCTIANVVSTLAGLLLIIAEIAIYITISVSELFAIFLLLLFPGACALSIWIEYKIYKRSWKDIPYKKLLKAVIVVNIITYIPLLILASYIHNQNYAKRLEKPRRISCKSNLKQIGLSLKQYADDYNGFFPDKGLEQLRANDYLSDYGVYNCPSTDTRKGKDNEKLTNEIVDYVYQRGLKYNSNDSKTPLLWDKPANHENYGNVLFIDGHVKAFKGADWMEQAGITQK